MQNRSGRSPQEAPLGHCERSLWVRRRKRVLLALDIHVLAVPSFSVVVAVAVVGCSSFSFSTDAISATASRFLAAAAAAVAAASSVFCIFSLTTPTTYSPTSPAPSSLLIRVRKCSASRSNLSHSQPPTPRGKEEGCVRNWKLTDPYPSGSGAPRPRTHDPIAPCNSQRRGP